MGGGGPAQRLTGAVKGQARVVTENVAEHPCGADHELGTGRPKAARAIDWRAVPLP